MTKRLTLNAEKRKTIADVFKAHWESEDNPKRQSHLKAIENYNHAREITKSLAEKVVRAHQPQEDVDTIRSMRQNIIEQVASCMKIIVFTSRNQSLKLMMRVESTNPKMTNMLSLV